MSGGGPSTRYLMLRAGEFLCLLPVGQVRRVVPRVAARPVPGAAPEVVGVGEVEGEPVAVLDLARLLGGEPDPRPERPVTVVVRAPGAEGLALDADEAIRLVSLPDDALVAQADPPASAAAVVDGASALVLDVARLGAEEPA